MTSAGSPSTARSGTAWLLRTAGAGTAAVLWLTGCSEPPPPAEEPTGQELERAWRIAVGEDRLDRTLAQIYSMALNSREAPTVVIERERSAAELAVALAEEPESVAPQADEDPDEDLGAQEDDDRYEIVLARTGPLAESLDPAGYADLTTPSSEEAGDLGPAAAPDELTDLISAQLTAAELFEPTAAVSTQALVITTITEAVLELEPDADNGLDDVAENCPNLAIGARADLPEPQPLLEAVYDCQPAEVVIGSESELIELLISADIDAALMSALAPAVEDHALVALPDVRQAFPQDQYAPVVSSRIAEDVPDVMVEISQRLDDQALLLLGRLIDGENALTAEEAAEYWLVEEDLIAEPDDWG